MMMINLFICNTEREFQYLKNRYLGNYLIGTVNTDFYLMCVNANEHAVFLETEDTMLNYHCDTWNIIKKINNIIKTCNLKQEYLYEVSYHIEGGLPSRIEDTLSNIRLLKGIIKTNNVKRICMVDSSQNWEINEAAFLIAYYEKIQYYILDEHECKEKDCLHTLVRTKYNSCNKKSIFNSEKQIDKINKLKNRKCKSDIISDEYDLGFI